MNLSEIEGVRKASSVERVTNSVTQASFQAVFAWIA